MDSPNSSPNHSLYTNKERPQKNQVNTTMDSPNSSPNHSLFTPTDDENPHLQNATLTQQSSLKSGLSLNPSDSDSEPSFETPIYEHRDDSVPIDAEMYMYLVCGDKNNILGRGVNLWELKCKEDKNSVLHVAACAGQGQLISDIIPLCKGIAKSKNWKGDTAFHCSAKSAQSDTLEALMDWGKYDVGAGISNFVLKEKNDDGDTALHIALEKNQEKMADTLVNECPQACYEVNEMRISPLYMAIKLKNLQLVKKMMNYIKQSEPSSFGHLMSGKSVVHAAIETDNIDILKELLENHGELVNAFDDEQTPLSYAAFKGYLAAVRYLLEKFPHLAYKCNKDEDGSFPIHKACSGGHVKVIKELYKTRHLLNREGQNILHVAAAHGKAEVVSYLLKIPELERLINLKDDRGNTPLHLAAKGFHPRVVYILTREPRMKQLLNKDGLTALDVAEIHAESPSTFETRLTWMALRYVNSPRSPQSTRQKYFRQKIEDPSDKTDLEHFKSRNDTLLLVATLVATVTFAAGFTVPGAYTQVGMAVLDHKKAFQVFTICNAAALYTSILTVVSLIWANLSDLQLILLSLKFALPLLGFSLSMMSVAFTTGLYVVLRDLPWLSNVVLGMGIVFLILVLLVFIPLVNPSYIKNSVVRFWFTGPFLLLLLACEKRTTKYD
ncbi:hypothetical protein RND81_04G078700 [Saponaria officinalis]|uniref:PGG domain-containing protein n=1 Tax=Saponaria officinalis TaxID=3572 RepID=A0AAW1LKP3_SAPOF